MDVKLVMFERNGRRKDFAITREISTVGRADDCILRIPLMSISRQHCKLIKSDNELQIQDMGSSNGTYINNRRVNKTVLNAGDRITLGTVTFTVQIDGKPEQISSAKVKTTEVAKKEAGELVDGEPEEFDPLSVLEELASDADEEKE
ncbi:MAG: FHA domain-containing protein [Planctomycetota bacterium]|nr:FHA domain-containing protein [Planctomycetota bacterium]